VSQLRLYMYTSWIKSDVLPLEPTCLYFSLLTQNPENLYDNRLAALYKVNWISEQIKIGTNLGSASYHSPEDLCLSIYLKTLRLNIQNHNSTCFYTGTKLPHTHYDKNQFDGVWQCSIGMNTSPSEAVRRRGWINSRTGIFRVCTVYQIKY